MVVVVAWDARDISCGQRYVRFLGWTIALDVKSQYYLHFQKSFCMLYIRQYVDLGYEGGGIGEYEYYNRNTKTWNDNACQYGNGRCVKMDCHLPDTHFSLLGFFKHDSDAYEEWFGQLFKHEGYCIWTGDEYSFMQSARESVPQKCKDTGMTGENNTAVYYHLKPLADGNITIGLYTDSACYKDYTGTAVTIAHLGWDQENIDAWNEAFSIYKICQPCTAYSLKEVSEDRRRRVEQQRALDGNGVFDCYDMAGYTNVNQVRYCV